MSRLKPHATHATARIAVRISIRIAARTDIARAQAWHIKAVAMDAAGGCN
jgi:hypothetical protein